MQASFRTFGLAVMAAVSSSWSRPDQWGVYAHRPRVPFLVPPTASWTSLSSSPLALALATALRTRGGGDANDSVTSSTTAAEGGAPSSSSTSSLPSTLSGMDELMKSAGIDKNKMDELMKSMGAGAAGANNNMPSVEESMEMMNNVVNSPQFDQYMNDPEQLERSRQMILNNPMMKNMMLSMPGMDEILNDADKWREAMQAAAEMYKSVGSNWLDMMGGSGGMGNMESLMNGMMGGGGGGNSDDAYAGLAGDTLGTALDELSEGDD